MAKTPPPVQSGFDNAKIYLWVKGLEGKVNNLLRETDLLKNDLIRKNNLMKKDMKILTNDVLDMKHNQEKTLQKMDLIIKELKKTAGIEEVMTLRKYVDFWNPINFVTQRDLDRAIETKLNEKKVMKH
jgi:hypothetical protein